MTKITAVFERAHTKDFEYGYLQFFVILWINRIEKIAYS